VVDGLVKEPEPRNPLRREKSSRPDLWGERWVTAASTRKLTATNAADLRGYAFQV